jgi:hypothetical protein
MLELFHILPPNVPYFLNNRINPHYKPPSSSSGVQMMGISYPMFLAVVIIAFLKWAFAMCLQFQVNR